MFKSKPARSSICSSDPRNVLQSRSKTINIKYLEWDAINTRHIAEKGIIYSDIEEAIFYGDWEIRRGKRYKRRGIVIQRYNLLVKAPNGINYLIVIEPLNRREGYWRCVTAWRIR